MTMHSTIAPAAHAPTTATPTAFDRALASYLAASNHLEALPENTSATVEDVAMDALSAADERLIATPAANWQDLRTKAEIIWRDSDSIPGQNHLSAFFSDLIRLTGNAPSRTFDPGRWLEHYERRGGGWVCRDGEVFLYGPDTERMKCLHFELRTRGGQEAVFALIRERQAQHGEV